MTLVRCHCMINQRNSGIIFLILSIYMLYLIRHGQSDFNYCADILLREKLGESFSKKKPQYLQLKFSPKFIDCGLNETGKEQCKKPKQMMEDVDVDVVVVSPMRRTLMTCDLIFREHKNKPMIKVDPSIRQVFSSSCDIGGRLLESMQEYPHFDYSQISNPHSWYIDSIRDSEVRQALLSRLKDTQEEIKNQKAQQIMLQYLKDEMENIHSKSFSDFQAQKQKIRQLGKQFKNIALVSHAENILAYTGYQPQNCEIVKVEMEKF